MSKHKQNPELQAIYDAVPEVNCKGLCQRFCGPIGMSKQEYDRMVSRAPFKPVSAECEGVIFLPMSPMDALKGHLNDMNSTEPCEYLNRDGRCMVYKDRPLICRIFGASQDPLMKCPHGCEPLEWLSEADAHSLLDRTKELPND